MAPQAPQAKGNVNPVMGALQRAGNYLMGKTVVNNATDPTSAYSKLMQASKTMKPPEKPFTRPSYGDLKSFGGKGWGP